MSSQEFAAYVEGLPPQDRVTVEQAMAGLREVLMDLPRDGRPADHDDVLDLIDVVQAATHA